MHLLIPFIAFAADRPDDSQGSNTLVHMRSTLMRMFFARADWAFYQKVSHWDPLEDPCNGWTGVRCEAGNVKRIAYSFESCGMLRILFVPQSVERLIIRACNQSEVLDTRNFPREARQIILSVNKYQGRLNLRVLPRYLEELNLMSNCVKGPIVLLDLPSTLQKLNLGGNHINQSIVYYGKLPKDIIGIYLFSNKVSNILRIDPDVEEADPEIFNEASSANEDSTLGVKFL